MTTTKPARNRTAATVVLQRRAPTYKRLPADKYADLDEIEKARHDFHVDGDAIFDAHPYATLDKNSFGFPSSVALTDTPRHTDEEALNAVEAASQRPEPAVDWLAEQVEARAAVTRTARLARFHWGFDPERGRDDPARPQKVNSVAVCAWCGDPAADGRGDDGKPLVRRVDGKPVHASPCYWTLSKQALRGGTTVTAHLLSNRPTGRK